MAPPSSALDEDDSGCAIEAVIAGSLDRVGALIYGARSGAEEKE